MWPTYCEIGKLFRHSFATEVQTRKLYDLSVHTTYVPVEYQDPTLPLPASPLRGFPVRFRPNSPS